MNAPALGIPSRIAAKLPVALSLAAIAVCALMIDLKGISTDEGMRLAIVNGGHAFTPELPRTGPTYGEVLEAVSPHAYQPGFYLLLNSLMRLGACQDLLFFRSVNIGFLALCLWGLLALSRQWAAWPRVFLVTLFAGNAYLIMHVLQIREYVAAVALYIWSTHLVLHLDQRELAREWRDVACFVGYGLLLTVGFYLQTWTVFPAVAQGAFLVLRRRAQMVRFFAHLALSYTVVFSLVWPYLRENGQKVNVGLWAPEKVTLLSQLSNGFHLVLSGHLAGHSWFTTLLPIAWLALMAAASGLLWRQRATQPADFRTESAPRQAWLMVLSMAVPLAFQIVYFYRVEPLSVWPRYFIIHYFFATWLIALAFRALHTMPASRWQRVALASVSLLLAASAVYQVRSYWRDPYFDTGTTAASNWPAIARAVHGAVHAHDVVFVDGFIVRSTLTVTKPLPNPVLLLTELEKTDLGNADRVVFLEATRNFPSRSEIAARIAARGFPEMQIWPVPAGDLSGPLPDWHILTFSRR